MDKFVTRSSSTPNLANKRPRDETGVQWSFPKRFAAPMRISKESETSTSNRFESLAVDGNDDILQSFRKATKKKPSGQVPPIVIDLRDDWDHQKIKDTIDTYDKSYHLQYRGNHCVKVQCYSTAGHQAVKEGLLKENITYHTFTRKDEKRPKAVIKGLPKFLQDTLSSDLAAIGFPDASVTELKTKKVVQCPPLLIQLPVGTDMGKFKQIKYVANCVVEIQPYKPIRNQGTQCFRCQGFGHASRNCNRQARCVKCSLGHLTSECPHQGAVDTARCCNCQQDHPANFSQCSVRLKYLDRIRSKREILRNAKSACFATKAIPASSMNFAQAVYSAKQSQHREPQTECNPAEPVNTTRLLHGITTNVAGGVNADPQLQDADTKEMLQILTTIKALKQEFRKCTSFMDKVILIMSHVGHYF